MHLGVQKCGHLFYLVHQFNLCFLIYGSQETCMMAATFEELYRGGCRL